MRPTSDTNDSVRYDDAELGTLFDDLFPVVCKCLRPLGASADAAKDVLVDFLTDFIDRLQRGDVLLESASLKTYAVRACSNIWISCLQKKSVHKDSIPLPNGLTEDKDLLEMIFRIERDRLIERAISQLDPECRAVIRARHLPGMGWNEVSESTGLKRDNIVRKGMTCLDRLRVIFRKDPIYRDIYREP